MLNENRAIFDALGITRWRDAGYTGAGLKIVTPERFPVTPNMNGKVHILWEDKYPVYENSHGYYTCMTVLEAFPDAEIYQIPMYFSTSGGKVSGFLMDTVLPWMLENKPQALFSSLSLIAGLDEFYSTISPFCAVFMNAGNYGSERYTSAIADKLAYGVGAVKYDGAFIAEDYSSESEYVDFASVGALNLPATNGAAIYKTGTSFSTPLLAAMAAAAMVYKNISATSIYAYIKAHCTDVHIPGKDVKTGYGVFVLPDPATTIEMTVGSNTYFVDGVQKQMDVAPFAQNNRTFVPIRFVAEALGCKVIWNPAEPNKVIIKK